MFKSQDTADYQSPQLYQDIETHDNTAESTNSDTANSDKQNSYLRYLAQFVQDTWPGLSQQASKYTELHYHWC